MAVQPIGPGDEQPNAERREFKRSYAGQLKKDLEASGISALLPGPVLDELVRPRIREKHLSEKFQLLSLARLLMTHSDRANGAIAS